MKHLAILGAAAVALAGCETLGPAFAPTDPAPPTVAVPQTPEEARAFLIELVRGEQAAGVEIVDLSPAEMAIVNRFCLAARLYPSRYDEASTTACALARVVGTPVPKPRPE